AVSVTDPLNQQDYRSLAKRVEKIQNGYILFFGSIWYHVEGWLTNPDSGYRYDASAHWTEIDDFSTKMGDIKMVWEKSRFTFLYDLIRYDHCFGRDQSSNVFSAMEDWI